MKRVSLIAIVSLILLLGVAAATLVYYESNTVETQTTVESPIVIEMNDGLPGTLYAGSCDMITVSGEYRANRPTVTIPLVVIGCNDSSVDMDPSEIATCGDEEDAFGEGGSVVGYISFRWGDNVTGTLELHEYGPYLYAFYEDGILCDPDNPTATATIDLMLHPEIYPAEYWVKVVCVSPTEDALAEALEDLTGVAWEEAYV